MSDDSDLSSDSEEEFLATGGNREALVRKKLLESFYGKSAVDGPTDKQDEDDDDDALYEGKSKRTSGDLDSPHFDPVAHTEKLVVNSSVHSLLETEEQLSLQVRTLDSTMQTLVYENYSRFIDATDAIKSIGVHVQANEQGMANLTKSMQALDNKSRDMEEALGSLRDEVAEKIRVKRLLRRLDTLLKLPTTLEQQIGAGQYKTATQSYLSAASILAKHSTGFESLKTIETECQTILTDMKAKIEKKMQHWSGRSFDLEDDDVPKPPQSMIDIFECVGTLRMLMKQKGQKSEGNIDDEVDEQMQEEDLQSMACSASLRLLERLLDSHLIDVQEGRMGILDPLEPQSGAASLIATGVLTTMVEAATLFSVEFPSAETTSMYLLELVSESFSSFLTHTKSILLDESAQRDNEDGGEATSVSEALALLVQSVKEVSTGLAQIGMKTDLTEKYLEQATKLSESMVRRRVDQKFQSLRASIVEDCLIPFTMHMQEDQSESGRLNLDAMIQVSQSTLSDCLQLVDDTIRSSLSEERAPAETPELKQALRVSSRKFAFWLANALEMLAGSECTEPEHLVEAFIVKQVDDGEPFAHDGKVVKAITGDDADEATGGGKSSMLPKLEEAIDSLQVDGCLSPDLYLIVAEMCHKAESLVPNSIEVSIATHLGGGKKVKSRNLTTEDNVVAKRFQLARSTVLVLYATAKGAALADTFYADAEEDARGDRPRDCAWKSLGVSKGCAEDFSRVFGGRKMAAKVTELQLDLPSNLSTSVIGRKTGLSLDIERMFKENFPIYPHPSELLEPTRDAMLFLCFKTAFRTLVEQSRLASFDAEAYSQLCTDTVFLKHMLPHYISSDYTANGTNACLALGSLLDDVADVAGERCSGDTEPKQVYIDQALVHVQEFLDEIEGQEEITRTFVMEETESVD